MTLVATTIEAAHVGGSEEVDEICKSDFDNAEVEANAKPIHHQFDDLQDNTQKEVAMKTYSSTQSLARGTWRHRCS